MKQIKTNEKNNKLIIDLTPKLLAGSRGYPKKFGRYSCSQLFKMLEHSKIPWGIPPEKYFDVEEPDLEGALRMINGVQQHELVQKYLDQSKNEIKFEYFYYGDGDPRNGTTQYIEEQGGMPIVIKPIFTLVGKVDHLPEDSVWEIKTSSAAFTKSKDYHDHQAKLYCVICDRPKAYILQPLVQDGRFVLKEIGQVERDDEWFAGEMRRLVNYHERLAIIHNK